MTYKFLIKKYPRFIYRKYSYQIEGGNLKISFFFEVNPDILFKPQIIIKNIPKSKIDLDNFIFHLGLMEIPSYWKATCSPEIIIKAGYLNKEQIKWWKDLIMKGMGQFFYENKIDWRVPNFLDMRCGHAMSKIRLDIACPILLRNRYLVPVGGGKDSIVTLEKLKKQKEEVNCFLVNPTRAAKNIIRIAGIRKPIIVERKIDPALLKLNKKGYLNGHTPFTAVLSFLSVFCAVLFGYKNIAFSNEKSADEGNVRYLGKVINHQYSKSSAFEKKFKNYCQKYLVKNINYFSFLRKYTELEISKMFTKYPKYFPVFSSCNVAGKARGPAFAKGFGEANRWCGNCPKCLFVYATLYPYLDKKELLKIFGKDLFDASTSSAQEKKNLLLIMKGLIGQGRAKPFECIGTYKESKTAFTLSLQKAKKSGKLPYLLTKLNVGRTQE